MERMWGDQSTQTKIIERVATKVNYFKWPARCVCHICQGKCVKDHWKVRTPHLP